MHKLCRCKLSVFVQQQHSVYSFNTSDSWVILSPIEQSIKRKIESVGTPLKDWDIQINYGIKTGFNEAFIITGVKRDEILANCSTEEERDKTAELIRPILRGRDIKRYSYEWADLWLIYIPWHFPLQFDPTIQGVSEKAELAFKEQYTSVYNHMLKYKNELSARNKAETGIRYEWYAMQRWGANYWEDFFKPKIIFQEMVQKPSFFYDKSEHFYCLDTGRIIIGERLSYLLGIMNSSLFFFAVKYFYGGGLLGETGIRMKHTFFENFPCYKQATTVAKEIELLVQQMGNEKDVIIKEINRKVYELYDLSKEEVNFIKNRLNDQQPIDF